jgi:hypothetical protein
MKIKALLCAVTVAVIVGGCATPAPGPRMLTTKQCPPTACDATITVDAAGNITIDYDVLKMGHGDRNPVVTWILDASNTYEFRADSIQPHTGAPSSGKETTDQRTWDSQIRYLTNNAKRFVVKNVNDNAVTLYYDVKVYLRGGSKFIGIDPAMVNDP